MTSHNRVTDATTNRRDVVPRPSPDEKPEPVKLVQFLLPLSVAQQIERAARYATDPRAYLEAVIGPSAVEKRKAFLSMPAKLDRDMYGTGEHKKHFEEHVARLLGKNSALFFITGVQAQLSAIKIHCQRAGNDRVAWHVTSHLETSEFKSYEELYGIDRLLLGSGEKKLPTVDEIRDVLSLPAAERPAAILVEIPNRVLGCQTYSFHELQNISASCREANVKLHMDGARLWEIEPYYHEKSGKTFADICALFDSVYVSFYKGLFGAAGAMLASDDETLIEDAKIWQRRAGGNPVTLYYELTDCERGYNENITTFAAKREKMLEVADGIKHATSTFKDRNGNAVVHFLSDPPTCCQTRTAFRGFTEDELLAARDRVEQKMNVRVFERLWPTKTLDEQNGGRRDGEGESNADGDNAQGEDRTREIEWFIQDVTMKIETKVFVDSYVALCEELDGNRTP